MIQTWCTSIFDGKEMRSFCSLLLNHTNFYLLQNALLKRHFIELTQSFMIPLVCMFTFTFSITFAFSFINEFITLVF